MQESSTRRHLLATVGVAGVAGVAGCLSGGDGSAGDGTTDDDGSAGDGTTDDDGSDGDGTTDDDGSDGDGTTDDDGSDGDRTTDGDGGTETGTGTGVDDELDLREANVVGVELESASDGTRFSVTLIHDDDGEDGYANWWAVETRDGEELGRRELSHAHGTQEFTRSATISVPDDVECVVVRGHDQTHDYGGQAAVVSVDSGPTRFVDQGADLQSFADASCP